MITTEKAYDMLPHMVDIFDKLEVKEYGTKRAKKVKDSKELGIDILKYVVKNSGKVKEEFFQVVAIAQDKTVEEVKKQGLMTTINTVKEIFKDDELMDFFKSAME